MAAHIHWCPVVPQSPAYHGHVCGSHACTPRGGSGPKECGGWACKRPHAAPIAFIPAEVRFGANIARVWAVDFLPSCSCTRKETAQSLNGDGTAGLSEMRAFWWPGRETMEQAAGKGHGASTRGWQLLALTFTAVMTLAIAVQGEHPPACLSRLGACVTAAGTGAARNKNNQALMFSC